MKPLDMDEQESLLNTKWVFLEEDFKELLDNEAPVEQEWSQKNHSISSSSFSPKRISWSIQDFNLNNYYSSSNKALEPLVEDVIETDGPNNQMSQKLHSQEGAARSDVRFSPLGNQESAFDLQPVMQAEGLHMVAPARQSTTMLNANYRVSATKSKPPMNSNNIETPQGISMPMQVNAASTGKKRPYEKIEEENYEKRQKTLIRCHEAGAKSRVNKKAYIKDLENKVRILENTIYSLKKEKADHMKDMENKIRRLEKTIFRLNEKETNGLLCSVPASKRRYQLRRTSSARF